MYEYSPDRTNTEETEFLYREWHFTKDLHKNPVSASFLPEKAN
ncbi:hypothetical protein [Microcoleus sp. B3-A4]